MAQEPTWEGILEVLGEEVGEGDPLGQYVEVTPRALAILNLRDCKGQLEGWMEEPLRLAQAAKSAHLALQSSLIDALAGSAGIGAHADKLRAAYLAYFEASREAEATPPKGDYVMRFDDLLERAMEHPMEWSGKRLEVSPDELKALDRLTHLRHRVEHPRPQFYFIEPLLIAQTLPVAARLSFELLDVCSHHYEQGQRASVEGTVIAITDLCAVIE